MLGRVAICSLCAVLLSWPPSEAAAAGNARDSGGNVSKGGNVSARSEAAETPLVWDKRPLDAQGRPLAGEVEVQPESEPPTGGYPQGEDNINVLHYDLHFNTIDFSAGTVEAVAVLTIEALEALPTELVLDFRGMAISEVLVDGAPTTFSRLGTGYAKLHVNLPSPVGLGETVEVTVAYSGRPVTLGSLGLLFSTTGGGYYACSMAEPNGANQWFPCNDRPDDKATLDLYATVEDGREVGSNGALLSETVDGGMRTFHWQEMHPISTYLIVMDAGDFTRVDVGGGPVPFVGYFTPANAGSGTTGLNYLAGLFVTFEDAFGPYPFDKYGHAEMPGFTYGGMEHQTLTTLHPSYLANFDVVAHELSHQWWGDLVGPASWDDLWLNEGFATYSEEIALCGKNRSPVGAALPNGCDWSRALNAPDYNNLFSYYLVYARGAWTVHHLRSYLGENAFWPALLYYRAQHEFGSASSEDLKNALEQSSGIELDAFFDRFVYHGGAPTISLYYFCDKRTGLGSRVIVRYERTDGFTCPDVVFLRLSFLNGETRVVRCVWEDPGTYTTVYDNRRVSSITVNPLDDYPYGGTISATGTLSDASGDGDTLPDGWELATLDTLSYGDADDPDGDGFDNAAECEADTNPLDAASAPVILTAIRTGSGPSEAVEITYPTSLFAFYTIETTTTPDSAPSWTVAEPKTRGTGVVKSWSESVASAQKSFYRLVVSKQ